MSIHAGQGYGLRQRKSDRQRLLHLRALLGACLLIVALCLATLTQAGSRGIISLGIPYASAKNEQGTHLDELRMQLVSFDNDVDRRLVIELLKTSPLRIQSLAVNSSQPTILIYHTHTTEAYTASEEYPYTERGGSYRTDDNTRNIVTVGELLADCLRSYGYNVIHDTTDHEPPKLSTSYSRSLETMNSYKKKYPSLKLFIDVHRDASGESGRSDYCVIDGVKTARLMFVVGTGKGATGTGFAEMPDFESNYALAYSITEKLYSVDDKLVRPIRVKSGRYNQHVTNSCLLVEVGHNMNTLEQALAATRQLAKAINEVHIENSLKD